MSMLWLVRGSSLPRPSLVGSPVLSAPGVLVLDQLCPDLSYRPGVDVSCPSFPYLCSRSPEPGVGKSLCGDWRRTGSASRGLP